MQNNPINYIDPSGLAEVPAGPPPVPVPGGGPDNGWKWNSNPRNRRGGTWGPQKPIPGQGQPSASWDPEGHWDVDSGKEKKDRRRYDEKGNPLTPDQAHGDGVKCEITPDDISPKYSAFDRKYWENITGLRGAALIVYIIISVGSRAIPAGNLIPVP